MSANQKNAMYCNALNALMCTFKNGLKRLVHNALCTQYIEEI